MQILLTTLILINLDFFEKKKYLETLIFISFIIIFLIIFFVYFQKGNLYTAPSYNLNIFGDIKTINSNGLSRSMLILQIFVLCKALISKKKNINYFLLLLSCLFTYLIISNESRINFLCLIASNLVIFYII